jgi:cell volume regulation protein A
MVLFSILVQGSLLPLVARKLDMIDDNSDVLKTFNDYAEETPIEFIRFQMKEDHLWVGQIINQIVLPPDNLIVLIIRGTWKKFCS